MMDSKYNYLVIEDDKSVWSNIERRMQKFPNWKALDFCSEIDDTLEKIGQYKPELIFTDWSIVGGNAFQILDFIQTTINYKPYIIIFTGYQEDRPEIPQRLMNDYTIVNKYLVKPIFQNLTENLADYVKEAENQSKLNVGNNFVFIENEYKQQVKILPIDCVAIIQCEKNPRIKILYLKNTEKIRIKTTWQRISNFLVLHQVDFVICHYRKSIVNRPYIARVSKPHIWLQNDLKIQVSRECWENFI